MISLTALKQSSTGSNSDEYGDGKIGLNSENFIIFFAIEVWCIFALSIIRLTLDFAFCILLLTIFEWSIIKIQKSLDAIFPSLLKHIQEPLGKTDRIKFV